MRPISPPTIPPPMNLPACDYNAHADCGCGCGGAGTCGGNGGALSVLTKCPWWVWLIAFGVIAWASGDETMKTLAFGPKVRRARRRA